MKVIWKLLFLLFVGFNSCSNVSSLRSKRQIKSSGLLGGSHDSLCEIPSAPKSGGIRCKSLARNNMLCTVTCSPGFKFSDGSSSKEHTCSGYDGIWIPSVRSLVCEPICNPPCQNGGHCFGNNRCVCAPRFRGDLCQYPISNCDGEKFSAVSWACNHTMTETLCTIACPLGLQFEHPPSSVYKCNVHGDWSPQTVPKCHSVDVFEHLKLDPIRQPIIIPSGSFHDTSKITYSVINANGKNQICSTWNQLHYKTFGGTMFSFQGKCTYLLARDCISNTFNIRVANDPYCNGVHKCQRQVIIEANNRRYVMDNSDNGPQVFLDKEILKIPSTINGLVVEKIGNYLILESGLGFKVGWNGIAGIFVELQNDMQNNTCGLCGRIDESGLSRDLELTDGSVTTNIVNFANSWKLNDFGEYCPDISSFDHHCKYDSPQNQAISVKAHEVCNKLFNADYSACRDLVDAQPYFEMCQMDFCGSEETDNEKDICSTFAAYFQECNKLGGKLSTNWRKPDFCAIECPQGLIYNDCGSSCPPTCKKGVQECSSDSCVEGCFCPTGTVLHENSCIQKDECPCFFNGKPYSNGERIDQDCNACICEKSRWECTKEKCSGRCSVIGDSHYTTFDGRIYDFAGKCSYYLIFNKDYSIEQENTACSGSVSDKMGYVTSKYPSCTKSIVVRIRDTVLHLKQRLEVTANGKEIQELPFSAPGVYVYSASSFYIKAELENGIVIVWDGISRVYIDAPSKLFDTTMGLCGTYNQNQKDDCLTGDGDIEQDIIAFANKWKTSESCIDISLEHMSQDSCELFPHRKELAKNYCDKLKSKTFAKCHDILDYESFHRNCLYDICHCQADVDDCFCPILADYGVKCNKQNQLVDWRKDIPECGISCPGEQVFQVRGSSCKRSCTDISYHTKCHEELFDGCNCPTGTTLNRYGDCIPISDCPCIHGEKEFQPGYLDTRGNMTCQCKNALWDCRTASVQEMSRYTSRQSDYQPLCNDEDNMENTDCASECVHTCKNMHAAPSCNSQICKPGCKCKNGYVLDTVSGRCVSKANCPCHHGGQSYGEGDEIKEECNTCVCESGVWNCEKKECPEICESWGSSHFKTFDGRMYEFHGDCDYVLARGGDEPYEKFSIVIRNVLCGTSDITCSKAVIFQIADEKVILNSDRPLTQMIYGSRFAVREVGLFIFIHTDIGITLQWDKKTRVYVRATIKWKSKVEGLCGNFDDDESNDFGTPDGGIAVAKATTFGDSWRVKDYCPTSKIINNTCETHPQRKGWALKQCSILRSSLFQRCHSEVRVEPYIERCIFDTCGCDMGGDCECLCTAIAAYAQECSNNGIVIKWRTQSLCPIQCEDCAEYSGCISVCPKPTCETEFLFEGVKHLCGNEACVEGCQPKPCPPGHRYNNPKEWKCIPESDCMKLEICKEINGVKYHEGERITDSEFSDACKSCYCRGGKAICIGKSCETNLTTTMSIPPETTPTTPAYAHECIESGWTEWMNGFTPNLINGGDYETIDNLRKSQYRFCPIEDIHSIQCRATDTRKHYQETGQKVWCSLPDGLTCVNKDQPAQKKCLDYEVRLYCECGERTPSVLEGCPMPLGMESKRIADQQISVSSYQSPDTLGNHARLHGWHSWKTKDVSHPQWIQIDLGEVKEVSGIITQGHPMDDEWITFYKLSSSDDGVDWTQVVKGETDRFIGNTDRSSPVTNLLGVPINTRFIRLEPIDWNTWISLRLEILGCALETSTEAITTTEKPFTITTTKEPSTETKYVTETSFGGDNVTSEVTWRPTVTTGFEIEEFPDLACDSWSPWYNMDNTSGDGIDSELFRRIPNFKKKCMLPISHECRTVSTWQSSHHTGQQFIQPCGSHGIVCQNSDKQKCDDYEIRVFCSCPKKCVPGFTKWFDIDDPSVGGGDFELIDEIIKKNDFCSKSSITDIQCEARSLSASQRLSIGKVGAKTFGKTSGSKTSSSKTSGKLSGSPLKLGLSAWVDFKQTGDIGVKCTTSDGLSCYNALQPYNRQCKDYRVRFLCDCGNEPTLPPTIPSTITTTTTAPPSEEKEICGWSSWLNSYSPAPGDGDNGDFESISHLPICKSENIQDINCRTADSKVSWSISGQVDLICDKSVGFLCENKFQNHGCYDYEVRVLCIPPGCTHTTTTTTTTTTTEAPTAPCLPGLTWSACAYSCDQMCHSFVHQKKLDDVCHEEAVCISGCITEDCASPNVWRDEKSCVKPQECTCMTDNGQLLAPGEVIQVGECDFCQCIENSLHCNTSVMCVTPTPSEGCISKWFDLHTPDAVGETETYQAIVDSGSQICNPDSITKIECRVKGTDTQHYDSEDNGVSCNLVDGLICENDLQYRRNCSDYEIRFHCGENCDEPTPTPPATPPPGCKAGFTEWFDLHTPDATGEIETFQAIENAKLKICKSELISDIECRVKGTDIQHDASEDQGVSCNLVDGLICENDLQYRRNCSDYEVRFFCDKDYCVDEPPIEPFPTPSCNFWSDWINEDKPWIGVGDIESLTNFHDFCKNGKVEAVECVVADSHLSVDESSEKHLVCSVAKGFSCLNKYQTNNMCKDYKIRYLCGCEVTTPKIPTPPKLCPETYEGAIDNCPAFCPPNQVCDGYNCIDELHCSCYHDNKLFKTGEIIETSSCQECICKLNGISHCYNKTCPVCSYGTEGYFNEHCQCECKTCPTGEILCPRDMICLAESKWCDGKIDCQDDEVGCPTITTTVTVPQETTTQCPTQIKPVCKTGWLLVVTNPNDPCPQYTCEREEPLPPMILPVYNCTMSSNIFKTFDGYEYNYEICNHVLVQEKEHGRFKITEQKVCLENHKDCKRILIVNHGKNTIKVDNLKVEYDGRVYDDKQLARLSKNKPQLTVKHVGEIILIKSDTFDFEVTWDASSNFKISVHPNLQTQVEGLCGYFNGNPDDDKMTPNGEEVNSFTDFGDSWSLGSLDKCEPATCPAHIMTEAEAACNQLRFSPFDVCNSVVDPTAHINVCKASFCECMLQSNSTSKDCTCKAYLPYVEACEINNVIKIRYWRSKQSCLPNCPLGLVWQDCGTACERTCENMAELHETDVCPNEQCVPGCFCPIGLVRKGDHCVKPEKCEDCVCKGYGDPHYFTYDGSYYPFQGNCTYVLSRDIVPEKTPKAKHIFEVYATNEDCHEEPMTTCTVAIMILYNDHIAHFRVNESVTFDGVQLFPSDFPFHAYGIHIESIPGRSVTFSIFDINLIVRYFELNYGFEIRLPSEVYYNKTEGLCGNCNFDNTDDFQCQDGKITNDTNEFAFSWVAKPPEGFESVDEICKAKEYPDDEPCKNSIELEMCSVLLQDVFKPCHTLVDPEVYMDACRFDMCHSVNPQSSLCRSATEYARKCAEVGICINTWRTKDFCPYQCPPGMQFQQCGSACPKSCKNIVVSDWKPKGGDFIPQENWSAEQTLLELVDVCDTTPVDGCFCHESKVFKDGQCVDPILCESCDDEGHKIGDSWSTDLCTSCVCTTKLTIECVRTQCPALLICSDKEDLHVIPANNKTCCNIYECVTKAVIECPQINDFPTCKNGEVMKTRSDANDCPEYYCECDIFQCPPLQTTLQLDAGEETHVVKKHCCPEIEIVCNTAKCPAKPVCEKFQNLVEKHYSTFKCCPEFFCEMKPNVCHYVHEFELVDGKQRLYGYDEDVPEITYKSGEIWKDGLCKNCSCEFSNGQYKQKCVVEICSSLNDYKDVKDYVWKTEVHPNVCCPKYTREKCVYQGQNYPIGKHWESEDDKCKHYYCDKLPTGEAIKVERFFTCDKNCKDGFDYLEPLQSSPDCCGKCRPVACIEDGQLHRIGSTWNSTSQKCFTGECFVSGEDTIQTRFNGPVCPTIPGNCIKTSLDESGCCEKCDEFEKGLPNLVCHPENIAPSQTIKTLNFTEYNIFCTNNYEIEDMAQCVGSCTSKSVYSTGKKEYVNSCSCCSPTKVEKKEIYLDCSNGQTRLLEYSQPTECTCSEVNCSEKPDFSKSEVYDLNQVAHSVFRRK